MPDEDIPIERMPVFQEQDVVLDPKMREKATKQHEIDADMKYNTTSFITVNEDIAPENYEEILIHANLHREHLQWWQQVELERRFHELKLKQFGKPKKGIKTGGWTLRDTANELQVSLGAISQDLRLAEAIMANPNLRKIEDKRTAVRLAVNMSKRMEAEALQAAPVDIDYNVAYNGDSATILAQLPAHCFDVCFTDPPWLDYKDRGLTKDDRTMPVFEQVYRVLKTDAFLYVICSTPDFYEYQKELPKLGFKVSGMPLIWHKRNVLSHGVRSWEYGRDYEPILLACKGSPVLSSAGQMSSIYSSAAVPPIKLIHPNEKPVDVPMYFLEHCSYEGSMVLDPFGGSGVTAEACHKMRRRYVTIEREKKYFDGIERRLANLVAVPDPNNTKTP